jgi:hypothetical protein
MFFSKKEKVLLFRKLEEHSISLTEIKKDLVFGSKRFEDIKKRHADFQDTRDKLNLHMDRHKTVNWVLSIAGGIIASMGTWWRYFKGN